MTHRITRFLAEARPETPCLIVDLEKIAECFCQLRDALPLVRIYYAVKANPAPEILRVLAGLGSNFDAASVQEVETCLAVGITPDRLSYGNTIKKSADIARAHGHGVRLFTVDSEMEVRKIAAAAPGARIMCRILMSGAGADWPLSMKFGCSPAMARDNLLLAQALGLVPYGVSFHVGSQQRDPAQWDVAVAKVAALFAELNARGIALQLVNLGGGLPAQYRAGIPAIRDYAQAIMQAMTRHFGNRLPEMIMEPGRYICGDAGILQSQVVLVSRKSEGDRRRWVYLDVGKFGGLAETMDESIKYRLRTSRDGGETGPVVLAGPTCDEADVLYEKTEYELPLDLSEGDRVEFLSAGAYTTTYSSVGFNGFPPLKAYYI